MRLPSGRFLPRAALGGARLVERVLPHTTHWQLVLLAPAGACEPLAALPLAGAPLRLPLLLHAYAAFTAADVFGAKADSRL